MPPFLPRLPLRASDEQWRVEGVLGKYRRRNKRKRERERLEKSVSSEKQLWGETKAAIVWRDASWMCFWAGAQPGWSLPVLPTRVTCALQKDPNRAVRLCINIIISQHQITGLYLAASVSVSHVKGNSMRRSIGIGSILPLQSLYLLIFLSLDFPSSFPPSLPSLAGGLGNQPAHPSCLDLSWPQWPDFITVGGLLIQGQKGWTITLDWTFAV